ncbi:universal stress protein [Fulvivirga lutea]|uniref:Universal stress protein n=1 Tax=Fulvivirga lutea TaxID=2810512 RepID=A0A974ZZC6_9BACT|nr:universal stress protein [Fulvivirga lutea]QSE95890.1 universal stress protein [Fulvivirga lutea]
MIKKLKLIFATDFTDAADNAMEYGIQFSKDLVGDNVEGILVHAHKHFVPYSNTPAIPVIENDSLKEELKDKLDERVNSLKNRLDVKQVFQRGNVTEVIKKLVDEEEPDMIIMGTRERGSFERMTLGTHTAEVIKKINCPVLAVPKEAQYKGVNNITLTADNESLNVNNKSLTLLKDFASRENIKFNVLHVFEDGKNKDLKAEMKNTALHRYISNIDHEHKPIADMEAFEGIIKYIDEDRPDLLMAIPRNRNFLKDLFHSSVSTKLIYHTQIPVLLLIDR